MAEREQEMKRASWVGIIGNALLSIIKIVAGLISGSLAVVADGIHYLRNNTVNRTVSYKAAQ